MKREEYRKECINIVMQMLDDQDEDGIYQTSRCYESLAALYDKILPSAEGAEAFVKSLGLNVDYVKGIDLFPNPKYTVIDLMREFAAQSQPTAGGAEEIIDKYPRSTEYPMFIHEGNAIAAMEEFATLHAQRLAEKMVEEKMREELMAYDKFLSNTYWGVSHLVKRDEAVDEYLKSREK